VDLEITSIVTGALAVEIRIHQWVIKERFGAELGTWRYFLRFFGADCA